MKDVFENNIVFAPDTTVDVVDVKTVVAADGNPVVATNGKYLKVEA